jgi:hypothetical protein
MADPEKHLAHCGNPLVHKKLISSLDVAHHEHDHEKYRAENNK